jgi:hypothetical protein
MRGKYLGIHEYRARCELLNFLNLLWALESRRFSRAMLMNELGVPYSIARAFSQGKSKNAFSCYKRLSDADPKVINVINELVAAIGQAEKVDKLLNKSPIEGGMYKGGKK